MTITGVFVSFILFLLLYINRRKFNGLVLEPFFWICVSYIQYFGFADISQSSVLVTDLANLFGFIVFLVFYYISRRNTKTRFIYKISTTAWPIKILSNNKYSVFPLSRGAIIFLTIAFASWAFLDLYTNAVAYGSLDAALVRFYVGRPINEIPISTIRFLNTLFTASVGIILVFRLNGVANKNLLCRQLFWIMFLIFEIVMIPKGTVGYVVYPLFIIVITDAILIKKKVLSSFPYILYMIIFPLVLMIGASLLTIRGGVYDRPQEAIEALDIGNWGKHREATDRGYSIVFEYTEKIINTYGNQKDYLPFYTLYSILVNPIPRELWPGKPYGFGKILAMDAGAPEESGVSYAAGIAGEGFANGGWVGVAFLAGLVGALCGFFAKFAFTLFQSPSTIHLLVAFQAWLAAQYFIRGDMLSAWGQAVYPLVFSLVALWFISKISRLLTRR